MDFAQLLGAGGIMAGVITAASVITQVILNKKLRTPADRAAEISTILTFFKEGITDSRADRKALEATTQDLRTYVDQLERNSREDFALRVSLEARIYDLDMCIKGKEERIKNLEIELEKYTKKVIAEQNSS